jgi:hypothetical protein
LSPRLNSWSRPIQKLSLFKKRHHMEDLNTIINWPPAADVRSSRAMLRTLLMSWRARLKPADAGLSSSGRVKGLRRKDVAMLVGVSQRWYEMFERGTAQRRFSTPFVMRVADALRLSRGERAILSRLALPEVAAAVEYFEQRARRG